MVICTMPLLVLGACATAYQKPTALESPKNSLPFFEKDLVEEAHSVSVPPFYMDKQGWRDDVEQLFRSEERVSVTPFERIHRVVVQDKIDLFLLPPERRLEAVAGVGRSVRSDMVMNGIILSGGGRDEIILQLVSSSDGRVVWWQAAEFIAERDIPHSAERKALLTRMLGALVSTMATKVNLSPGPSVLPGHEAGSRQAEIQSDPESLQKVHTQEKPAPKPRQDKRPKKERKPVPADEDISPM